MTKREAMVAAKKDVSCGFLKAALDAADIAVSCEMIGSWSMALRAEAWVYTEPFLREKTDGRGRGTVAARRPRPQVEQMRVKPDFLRGLPHSDPSLKVGEGFC